MRLIFLDLDGVINSAESAAAIQVVTGRRVYPGPTFAEEPFTRENLNWSMKLVQNLKRLVEKTDAKIVISSAWREKFGWMGQFIEMFEAYGWNDAPVIGLTPTYLYNRGQEIDEWISKNGPVDSYVILDDNDDFSVDQKKHFVHTDNHTGLTDVDVKKAIRILIRQE